MDEERRRKALLAAYAVQWSPNVLLKWLRFWGGIPEAVASQFSNLSQFSEPVMALSVSEPFKDGAQFRARLTVLVNLWMSASSATAVLALELCSRIKEMGGSLENTANRYDTYCQLECSRLELDFVFEVFDIDTSRQAIFDAAFSLLPPSSAMEVDGQPWPYFAAQEPGEPSPAMLPAALYPLAHKKLGFAWRTLPPLGRMMAIRSLITLNGGNAAPLQYMQLAHAAAAPEFQRDLQDAVKAAALRGTPDGGESNAERQFRRVAYLAGLSVIQLVALHQVTDTAPAFHPGLDLSFRDSVLAYLKAADFLLAAEALVRTLWDDTMHMVESGWSLQPMKGSLGRPSVAAQGPSGADSTLGMRFLSDQLKIQGSRYRMPALKSPQKVWEDWFARVRQLPVLYPGLTAAHILPVLLSIVGPEDERIFGWAETSIALEAAHQTVSLPQFLAHVRKQVLPAGSSRHQAAQELEALEGDLSSVTDCLALSTRLRQLFAQIFPPHSEEVEPITRVVAAKIVHRLMGYLGRASIKFSVAKAWREYDSYQHSAMFTKFLDETLHTSQLASVKLTSEYLDQVCMHLEAAHRQYIQLRGLSHSDTRLVNSLVPSKRDNSGKSHSQRSGGADTSASTTIQSQKQVNALAGSRLGRDHSAFGSKRPRRSQSGGSRGDKAHKGAAMSSKPAVQYQKALSSTGYGSYTPIQTSDSAPPTAGEQSARIRRAVQHVNQYAAAHRYKCGQFRHTLDASLRPTSEQDFEQAVLEGACILCQNRGHRANNCPSYRSAPPDRKVDAQAFKRIYFDAFYSALSTPLPTL